MLRKVYGILALIIGSLGSAGPIVGQGTPAPGEDEVAVRAVIDGLFRGMLEADSALARSAFDPGARFASATREGIRYDAVDGWIAAIATSEGKWDERIYDVSIRVDRPVAAAWVPYTFYLDGALSHCGVNTIELLLTTAGWKITQLSDSRRREGCPDPRSEEAEAGSQRP